MSEATNGRGGGGGGGAVAEAAADASVASTNNNKKEVMQSNLPLLFANGSPISLESMSLSELQHFLLFLLKCECGREITTLSDIDPPTWWPIDDVAFEDELLQKSAKKGMWSSVLRKLIKKCYAHHGSDFLLEFSRKLMIATQDTNKIKVIDNGDGTRSMRSASSDKLLVTFRSENQEYDKKQRQQLNRFSTQSPLKKCCSLSLGINASDPRLPQYDDLYLCDNCGADFECLQDVLVHEKNCQDVSTERADEFHQKYFAYLKLGPPKCASSDDTTVNKIGNIGCQTKDSSSSSSKVVRPKPSTYAKFLSIDVSSPLGQYIYSLSKSTEDIIDIASLCMAERKTALRSVIPQSPDAEILSASQYLPAILKGGHGEEYPVSYRGHRLRNARKQDSHVYCFNRRQKAVRRFTLDKGMTPRTMKLYKQLKTKRLRVTVKKLQLDKLSDIIKEWLANSEKRRQERERKRTKLKLLKEQARHFEPYVPKLTSTYQLNKQSSVSVLQSFTSAVQQLCSPEKNGFKKSRPRAGRVRSGGPSPAAEVVSPPKKKITNGNVQCIDLCSSSDDEVELRNHNQIER